MTKVKLEKPSRFIYKDNNGQEQSIKIDSQLEAQVLQMKQDYLDSKNFIDRTWIHTWNKSLKSYLLYMGDREAILQDWQTNIAMGLIRSQVDTYAAFLTNTPLQFVPTPLSAKAFQPSQSDPMKTNIDMVRQGVNFIADVTKFNEEIVLGMIEGVTLGVTVFKTSHDVGLDETLKVLTMIDDQFQEVEFVYPKLNVPKTTSVDPYHIFPDFGNRKNPEHVIERNVVSINHFLEMFMPLISHESNKLKSVISSLEISKILVMNKNQADFVDYGNIRDEIYAAQNKKFSLGDTIYNKNRPTTTSLSGSDQEVNDKNKVEFYYGTYKDRIILMANNYPLYIGDNFYKIIPYDFCTMYSTRSLYSEGLPYLLFGLEDMQNSFGNNLIDNARVAAVGRMIGNRESFSQTEEEIESLPPGGIAWVDGGSTENALRPMPTPNVTDYGIMTMAENFAQKQSGISEINQGVASKVRTAAEAASLVGSTNNRINQFFKRFSNSVGKVAETWLRITPLLWTQKTWGYTKDIDGKVTPFEVTAKDLEGYYTVTLDSQGLFAMNAESQLANMLKVYQTFQNDFPPEAKKELAKNIIRAMGLNPSVILPENVQMVDQNAAPPEPSPIGDALGGAAGGGAIPNTPVDNFAQDIGKAMNTQVDLGNGGKGQG